MPDTWLNDLMKRVVAMEIESLTENGVGGVGGAHYFPYMQETFPYFVNRLADITVIKENTAEDVFHYQINIEVLLVVAHMDSGFQGEKTEAIYDYITYLLAYLSEDIHQDLQSTAYPTTPRYLNPLGLTPDLSPGVNVFTNSGLGVNQVGTRFTLTVDYEFLL